MQVIMLHHVSDLEIHKSLQPYCIRREKFQQLLSYLDKHSYRCTTFQENCFQKERNGAFKDIILTFDDCPRHLFDYVIPELDKRQMKAVFFMPTAYIGGYNEWDVAEGRAKVELMTESDIKELVNLGMEVGSHSHHHVHLKNINSRESLQFELSQSKKILKDITGTNIQSFAYPFGSVPKDYKELMKQADYLYSCSIYYPWKGRYALRRFIYHDGDTEVTLRQKLSRTYDLYRSLTDPLKKY